MKASDVLIRCLENEGVEYLFGLPGEENLDVMDSLVDSNITFVTTRHEQGAAFMADVFGRLTRKAGVCLSTLGPGALNLLTGVADANLDRVPLVALTGQVSMDRMHKESHQYIDAVSILKPVTKWNTEIKTLQVIPETVRKAFKIAQTEKPGATHLDLAEDIAGAPIESDELPLRVQAPISPEPSVKTVRRAVETLGHAKKPLILAGNGAIRNQAYQAIREFAEGLHIPLLNTFMAKGILPPQSPMFAGTLGLQFRDYASVVMEQADVVITIGYDFVEYAPAKWNPDRDKKIIHIDSTPAEVDAHYIVNVGVLGNLSLSLQEIQSKLDPFGLPWAQYANQFTSDGLIREMDCPVGWPLQPQHVVKELRAALNPEALVICDVGAHKLWMARMFSCDYPNTCIISNGFAAMGISLPGALSAKLAFPDRQVVAVTGDGGFLMNCQELETAVRCRLPIVVVIWRDNGYGVIRWKQLNQFGRTFGVDFENPNYVELAKSFGIKGFSVTHKAELAPILQEALRQNGPVVIDCPVDYTENLKLTERLKQL